jgi:hypothetical protein
MKKETNYYDEETLEIAKRLKGYVAYRPNIMMELDEGTDNHQIYVASSYHSANDERCANCKFYERYTYDCANYDNFSWEATEEITHGKCLRYPPQFQNHGEQGFQPTVENIMWCGEYVRAPDSIYINGAHGIPASLLKDEDEQKKRG